MCHIHLQANASEKAALANSLTSETDRRPATADADVSFKYICACQNCFCHGYSTQQLVLICSVVAAAAAKPTST